MADIAEARYGRLDRRADIFTIAAADTLMPQPSAALMAESFPGVPVRGELGAFETLLSIDKARRVLGYRPRHTWRGAIGPA